MELQSSVMKQGGRIMIHVLPEEYGKRIKRARQAKGLTQKQLAELANLSDSAISKYETQGTLDVNVLNHLSNVLGASLFSSPADAEGTIGIVGKEIMSQIVLHEGYIDFHVLLKNMHGMGEDVIAEEIVKLSSLGVVVRESYRRFDDSVNDGLFITAKGIFAYKGEISDIDSTEEMRNLITNCKSYEQLLEGHECYQDYVNAHELERLIYNLDYVGSYRLDYIIYLKRKYHLNMIGTWEQKNLTRLDRLVPAKSFYHDLLYKMAFDITNDVLWGLIDSGIMAGAWKYEQEYKQLMDMKDQQERVSIVRRDPVAQQVMRDFVELLPEWYEGFEEYIYDSLHWLEKRKDSNSVNVSEKRYLLNPQGKYVYEWEHDMFDEERFEELSQKYRELEELIAHHDAIYGDYQGYLEKKYVLLSKQKESLEHWHDEWYTADEQMEFIESNFPTAKTKEEKELDRKLREINKLCPETLDYYLMPNACGKNGITELIWKRYKL